jgi:methyl-accepting chemotaxis protein/methyl-accepting chemotaxis protein-1 (serine sensor receptor)
LGEESTAASHTLAAEAAALTALLANFKLGEATATAVRHAPPPPAPRSIATPRATVRAASTTTPAVQSPARSLGQKLAGAFQGGAAAPANDSWDEF